MFEEHLGNIVNTAAIIAGALVGVLLKNHIKEKYTLAVQQALAFVTLLIGLKMALQFNDIIVVALCLVSGLIIGNFLELESWVHKLAEVMKRRVSRFSGTSKFIEGFSATSILYCAGSMAVLGAIQSGAFRDHSVLYSKALLDGFSSVAFSAIYGIGVLFSAVSVFFYQGAIVLTSSHLDFLQNETILNDLSGVGGILLLMIGFNLLNMTKIQVTNFMPSIFLVIAYYALAL